MLAATWDPPKRLSGNAEALKHESPRRCGGGLGSLQMERVYRIRKCHASAERRRARRRRVTSICMARANAGFTRQSQSRTAGALGALAHADGLFRVKRPLRTILSDN